jgi:hypothetical protein
VLGGEAAFTGLSTAASTPGRPTVPQTVAGVVLTLGVRAALLLCWRHALLAGCPFWPASGAAFQTLLQSATTCYDAFSPIPPTMQAAAGASQDGFVCTAGCAVGALAGAAMLSIMIQRALQTPFNPNDFPGAKAWPATMGLISFFSLAVFWQALVAALK